MAGKKHHPCSNSTGDSRQTALHPEEKSTCRMEKICGLGTGSRFKRVEFHS